MGNVRFYVDIMALHNGVTGSGIPIVIKFPDGECKKVLIDLGLFQESEYYNLNDTLPFNPAGIDYVLVTHNHIDHTGRLPLLAKKGYCGKIHVSNTTSKLIRHAMYDSSKVIKTRAKLANESPIYDDEDVDQTLNLIEPHPFEESFCLYTDSTKRIEATFFMNGHLPGAVIILLQIQYHDSSNIHYEDINMLFTGDYNNKNLFFDVKPLPDWVYELPLTIIQEATYGNMNSTDIKPVFNANIVDAVSQGKEIVVPVFSLGRSQEILYTLRLLQQQGCISTNYPIYFAGKLGQNYTDLYLKDGLDNKEECKDFMPANCTYITDCDMQKNISNDGQPKIILTTSGMGSYGPAQTFLPFYIKQPNALIHFTGYCAEGTLGRRLYDCKKGDTVDIAGLQVKKKADVQFTSEFSAHAKADELIDFLKHLNIKLLLVNHGEPEKKDIYANRVINEIDPKNVGILNRDYLFRIDGYGFVKSFSTKFR